MPNWRAACVDSGDPEAAISAFFQLAAYKRVTHCFVYGVFSNRKDVFPAAKITFGGLEDFFPAMLGSDRIYRTWHNTFFSATQGSEVFSDTFACVLVKKETLEIRW